MKREEFISIWGTKAALALAIGEGDVKVRHWFRRGSIPAKYDGKIISAAERAGRTITHQDMFDLRQDIALQKEGAA